MLGAVLVAVVAPGCSAKTKRDRIQVRAESYFSSGEIEKAKIEYLNLLRADPKNAAAIERLGVIWFQQGAPLQALKYLPAARDLHPDDLDIRTKLALAYAGVGHTAEARSEALAILKQSPNHDEALLLLADTALSPEDIAATEQQLSDEAVTDKVSRHLARATLLLRKGRPDGVAPEVERALALDPKSPLAQLALANLRWSKNDLVGAGEAFKAAADLSPPRSNVRLKSVEFKVSTRATDEAKALLKEITDQTPDFLPAWNLRAQIASGELKYDEALAFIENVLGRDAENFDARMLQAIVWLARGDTEKAERGLEALDQRHPGMPQIKYQLARVYLERNKTNQATLALGEALTANPDFTEAQLLLAIINLRRGDASATVASMEDLLKKSPTLLQPQLLLVEAYRSVARLDDALVILREQIAAMPQNGTSYFLLGVVLRQKKQPAEAREAFEKALALAPENALFLSQIITLEIEEKRFPAALERVQAALAKTPGSAGMQFLMGKIYASQGDWPRAEEALLATLKLDPDFSSASQLLVSNYIATKRLPLALAQLDRILAKNPDDPTALRYSALIYEKMGESAKARDSYEKILTLAPDDAATMNNLAYLYAEKLNQLDRAHELARKVTTLYPRDPASADTLGWVLYKRGEYAQALALFETSAIKLGDYPEVQFHLGMANYMMGRFDVARTALQKAAQAPAEFPGKAEAQQRLAMLAEGGGKTAALPVEALEAMLKDHPDDLLVRTRLAEAYEMKGDPAKAATAWEAAFKLNPRLLAAALKIAQLNAGPLQNKEKALEFAKKAKELAPSDPAVAGTLGALVYQSGNYPWAYSLLQEGARPPTAEPAILHSFAWAAYSLGKVDEARATMQRVLTVAPPAPQSAEAATFLQMTALDQQPKDLAAAEPEVEKLLKADASYIPALMARGALQTGRGEAKVAAGTYQEILRRFPDFAPAQKYLAALYFNDPENRPKARELAIKARKTLPEDPELAQTLGVISYDKKEYAYARQLLVESARKRPLDATGLFYLGMAHFQAKEKPQSRDALNQALAAGLQDPLAAEARRVIAELPKE